MRLLIFLMIALVGSLGAECITLPDPREQAEEESCTKKSCCSCKRYCKPTCRCNCNPYKCSDVDNVPDEVDPTWPSRMDLPFQEEFMR